jgi:hypothetical protein
VFGGLITNGPQKLEFKSTILNSVLVINQLNFGYHLSYRLLKRTFASRKFTGWQVDMLTG